MYCSTCKCEFAGLKKACPYCKSPLVRKFQAVPGPGDHANPNGELIELVKQHGGRVEVAMVTTDVGHYRTFSFPYIGRGFGWERKMQGRFDDCALDLETTEVAIERTWRLFYRGYGFAWARKMQGLVAGCTLTLVADEVGTESGWMFPYFGYGYSWIKSMTGQCGDQLTASFRTTEVARKKESFFPFFGFGYAWADKGVLTLALKGT